MIDLMDIPDDELNRYFRLLIPRLLRYKPGEWVPIALLANDPSRFMDVVVCMNNYRYFDDKQGFSMVEVSNDEKFIRICRTNLELYNIDDNYRWKWENIIK